MCDASTHRIEASLCGCKFGRVIDNVVIDSVMWLMCRPFSTTGLTRTSGWLCRRAAPVFVAGAAIVYFAGRWAVPALAGAGMAAWLGGVIVINEVARREARDRSPVHLTRLRCQSPVTLPDGIDTELAELAAGQVPCGECPTCLANRQEVPA